MHPYPFAYHRATSVAEALSLLASEDEGKLLAGGQSLLPVMKLRLAQPGALIDISEISELRGARVEGDTLVIGALTTHHELETDPVIAEHAPLLAEIARVVGDMQVRNRGTLGGAIAHADPAADYPAGVLALDATVVAQGPDGSREVPIGEFFQGFMTTALDPGEIITAIRVPLAKPGTGVSYQKLANPASGYAIAGIAAVVEKAADGTIGALRLGITGVGDIAYRATAVEEALAGQQPTEEAVKAAAANAVDGIEPLDDLHAPAAYRAKVARNLARRAIITAVERAS
ncbi:MAG TPA: xanthine dehydrogenase family protein subunit M [Thermomicrobiales bacterium]|nr:xanthine dehydrogenase family protein subunit M [Thermomicrobiales bacterium]